MGAVTQPGLAQPNGLAGAETAPRKPMTVPEFMAAKTRGVRLTMLTAYDYTMARLLDAAGVDSILVGDSLGMVVQGNTTSLPVTLDEIIYHTRCVARGVTRSLIVADLPFMSYQVSPQQALQSAGRLIKEGGAHAVKLEGGTRSVPAIAAIVAADIPVMGHIAMTPQSVHLLGGFRVQRDEQRLMEDAQATEKAGAFAVVVECVPAELGRKITASLRIPTIGIGAWPELRRPGSGHTRHARPVRRPESALRQALRRPGQRPQKSRRDLLPRGPRGRLPVGGIQLPVT